jgi:valyl-tRNA synthetase
MNSEPKIKEKAWSKEMEKPIYEEWKNKEIYKFDKNSKKPTFSIDTPPPYVNTPVHIGQATTYVLMDMFARFRRMTGFNVLFPLGLDRNGLPIEMAAEKRFKVKLSDVSREEFIEFCKKILEESSTATEETFLRLGISFNSWKTGNEIGDIYLTDSPDYRALTQETFIDLWKKGLIYEDERITNFCPGCQTTLADAEVEYAELPTYYNNVLFRVKEGSTITISTTRPELICTCGMIIFHPDDKRYRQLNGKKAITPLYNKEIPIKAHPMAEMEKGTGLVMMCSAGDSSDVRFFREMNLTPTIAINKDGRMNKNAGFLEGLKVAEARKTIIQELKDKKLLVSQTPTIHRTPICERSKDEIEFIVMKEYYLKQIEFKGEIKEIANKMNFFSPNSRQILIDWIDSVSIDWPISRRRYYATEIPLWYCKCGNIIVPPKGRYYQPWKEDPPIKKCPKCSSTELRGDERVFDTWFDSSITPLYILKYSRDDEFFKNNFPCSLRPQGKEIIRTWLYYTLLKDYLLTGKQAFRDVWINYHVVDERGKKMSKSKGNVVNPRDVLNLYGAEPFRFWSAIEGSLEKTDFRCSFERIEGAGKTLTKLWNVAKFVSIFPQEGKHKLMETDKWIIQELNDIIDYARESYANYDFHNPTVRIKHFIWETFASNYLELAKARAYNQEGFSKEEQNAAIYALNYCLDNILKLLSPIIPFLTYKIYLNLRNKDIRKEKFPEPEGEYKVSFKIEELTALNSEIWKAKKDKGLSLKAEIKELTLPEKFKGIEKDLIATHKIKKLTYGSRVEIIF